MRAFNGPSFHEGRGSAAQHVAAVKAKKRIQTQVLDVFVAIFA
jgi:hypothetical protein